ncbi:FimD/PapC C-terminal domain-containing protein, partial [Yersinia sp. 2542 StPb PI]
PFGANAYNAAGDSLGVVGQGGNIILSSEKSQSITIVWNSKEGIQKCFINYIPELYSDYENIKIVNTICRNESS